MVGGKTNVIYKSVYVCLDKCSRLTMYLNSSKVFTAFWILMVSSSSDRNDVTLQMLQKSLASIMFYLKAVKCVFLVRGPSSPKAELQALIALCVCPLTAIS